MKEGRAAKSYLIRLMAHIIKWFSQPEKRSESWRRSINDSRDKLEDIQDKRPSVNKKFLLKLWDDAFGKAKKKAEEEMGKSSDIEGLTEKEVFDDEYRIEGDENPQAIDPKKAKKRGKRKK